MIGIGWRMVDSPGRSGFGVGFEVPPGGTAPGRVKGEGSLHAEVVAEISGEYGSFVFPERVLQKLWLRREVDDGDARLQDGRRVRVREPGRWNHLGGPDFGSAVVEIDGCRRVGDVEVHLWERDWYAHGHGADPAYDGVVLHAVLFPTVEAWTKGREERRIPILVLLPLLRRGLEDYAADEVIERLAGRPETRILDILQGCTPTERRERVLAAAVARWQEKVRWARLRLERLGWREACHHAALQALGARPNRAAMLQVASVWSLSAWQHGQEIPGLAWAGQRSRWTVQGVRPANHPQRRLQQYAEWVARVPEWPERLWEFPWPAVADIAGEVANVRRGVDLSHLRKWACGAVAGGVVRGGRFDSLVCDSWLPLLAARGRDVAGLWFHWFPGELASTLRHAREMADGGAAGGPLCQGVAQGLWAIGMNSEIPLQ